MPEAEWTAPGKAPRMERGAEIPNEGYLGMWKRGNEVSQIAYLTLEIF